MKFSFWSISQITNFKRLNNSSEFLLNQFGFIIYNHQIEMKRINQLLFALLCSSINVFAAPTVIHVWETTELTFAAKNSYRNPYKDLTVWIDLSGPGFNK